MRSLAGLLCVGFLAASSCGQSASSTEDAAASSDVAISSGRTVGTGGAIGTGGLTTAGGVGGAFGGALGSGRSTDAGRDVPLPIRETEAYTSCVSTDDCHVVLDECVCAAVNAQGAELVDKTIPCGTNDCLSVVRRVTDAVCETGKCTLVRDPPCTADTDCHVLWARCYPPPLTRDCACAAVHVSNQATRELASPDGMCTRNMSENGRAFCENGRCSLVGVYPG